MKFYYKQSITHQISSRLTLICILSLFSVGILAQKKHDNKKEIIKPGKRQAVLILSDGSRVKLSANDSLNYSTIQEHQINDSLSSQSPKKKKFILNDKNKPSSKQKVPNHTESLE